MIYSDDDDLRSAGHLRWPEALAITVMLGMIALLATGWVDPLVLLWP